MICAISISFCIIQHICLHYLFLVDVFFVGLSDISSFYVYTQNTNNVHEAENSWRSYGLISRTVKSVQNYSYDQRRSQMSAGQRSVDETFSQDAQLNMSRQINAQNTMTNSFKAPRQRGSCFRLPSCGIFSSAKEIGAKQQAKGALT